MKKTIYLVRHGQTEYNTRLIHQHNAVPLSALGEKQARAVAKDLAQRGIDVLLASDIHRAQQTAETIAQATGKKVISEALFEEFRRPSDLAEKWYFNPRSVYVFTLLYLRAANIDWHHSDEENFAEFRDRAHEAIEYLERYDAERIAVVSHRAIIGGMLAGLECGFACSMGTYIRANLRWGHIANASVTTLTYDPEREDPWQVEQYNDTRHLMGI